MKIQWNAFCLPGKETKKTGFRSLRQNTIHCMLSDNKFYICSLYQGLNFICPGIFKNLYINAMKAILCILLMFAAVSSFSQNTSQYDNILLNTAADYRKAEPQVSLAADYVYSTPIDKENINRRNAIAFILKWMQGTSDYSFAVDESMRKITNDDRELIGVYAACITGYALRKGKGVDREELKLNSYRMLAQYCENPSNNYKPRGEMKKMIDAKNQNRLKEYLDSRVKK